MEIHDVMREMMVGRQRDIADRMGIRESTLSDKLSRRSDLKVSTLVRYCEANGCELVVRGEREWVIDATGKDI